MIRNPKVSVIMSVYQEPISWIQHSIDSILNQTFEDFEFIIVNDNPNRKENLELLEEYSRKDYRIKTIFNDVNIGLTKCLNRAIETANGKYLARMDADDISLPQRFEEQVAFMDNHPNVVVLGTNIKPFGQNGKWILWDIIKFDNESIKDQMLFDNPIAHPTVFIRKKTLDINNIRYDEEYRQSQDCRLWEQLYLLGDFANLKKKLLKYRISESQISVTKKNSQGTLANHVQIRLQKLWLKEEGYDFTLDELKNTPFKILSKIREMPLSRTKKFNAFVQYSYLKSPCGMDNKMLFFERDWKYFSFINALKYIKLILGF